METRNVLLAVILSTIVIVSWGTFFAPVPTEKEALEEQISKNKDSSTPSIEGNAGKTEISRSSAIKKSKRIKLENENIKVSYYEKISKKGGVVASYKHSDNKLAAIVKIDSGDEEVGRDIAMQVAANNPMAIYPEDIDEDILNKEKEIALATLANENKPEEIKEKIIMGKLNKFKMENSLVEQPFIKDPDKKIKDLLGGSKIIGFCNGIARNFNGSATVPLEFRMGLAIVPFAFQWFAMVP